MSKLRARQDADGAWVVASRAKKSTGHGDTFGEARANMSSSYWFETAVYRTDDVRHAEQEARASKRRLNTWRSIAIAQFVVIVATGAIMWIGG